MTTKGLWADPLDAVFAWMHGLKCENKDTIKQHQKHYYWSTTTLYFFHLHHSTPRYITVTKTYLLWILTAS